MLFLYFEIWNFVAPRLKTFLHFFRKKLFLYFGNLNFLVPTLKNFRRELFEFKKTKKPTPKKLLIFWEMELSNLKLKKLGRPEKQKFLVYRDY